MIGVSCRLTPFPRGGGAGPGGGFTALQWLGVTFYATGKGICGDWDAPHSAAANPQHSRGGCYRHFISGGPWTRPNLCCGGVRLPDHNPCETPLSTAIPSTIWSSCEPLLVVRSAADEKAGSEVSSFFAVATEGRSRGGTWNEGRVHPVLPQRARWDQNNLSNRKTLSDVSFTGDGLLMATP